MRRRNRRHYVDLSELIQNEMEWQETQRLCAGQMQLFDRLPPRLKQVCDDTGVNIEHAIAWLNHFRPGMTPAEADQAAADQVRQLVHEQFVKKMKQGESDLAAMGTQLKSQLRRSRSA